MAQQGEGALANVAVLGSGNFGTCLAQHLAVKGYPVTLWGRSVDIAKAINTQKRNPHYLSEVTLSDLIKATTDLTDAAILQAEMLVIAVPTQSVREVLTKLKGLARKP